MARPELYYEKFRCKSLEQMALLPRIKDSIPNDGKLSTNMLLYSATPGMGKTTLARILAKNTTNAILEINASRENSVDVIRERIVDFSATLSVFDGEEDEFKVIILDECLEENEEVRIGTLENWKPIKLKDLVKGVIYPCVSMNIETGKLENDTCEIISEKEEEVFEVELENGNKILVTSNHPFMIMDENNVISEKTIDGGLNATDYVCIV